MMITEPAFDNPKITNVDNVTIRRCSTGKIMMSNVGTTVISRYLRNPQISCHDICKFGARNSIPKAVKPKHVVARQAQTGTVGNFGEGMKKCVVTKSTISLGSKTRKPDDQVKGNLLDGKKLETDLGMKPFPDSGTGKPVASACTRNESWSWTDKETVSPKRKSLPSKQTNIAIEHARFSKMKPRWKAPCSSDRMNIRDSRSKNTDVMTMVSLEVLSGRHRGIGSSSMIKAKTNNSKGVFHSRKQQNSKEFKVEKSCDKNGEGSRNLKGVSHLTDQKSITKPNSLDIPEKTVFMIDSNPENKPAEAKSDQASDLPKMSSLISKDGYFEHTQNKAPKIESLHSFKKKNMMETSSKYVHSEKLNFKRGKVIELPLEDCTPRRLEFKQRAFINSKNGQNNSIEGQGEQISLRQNNSEEKKISWNLYNNMIEETAIRLVSTRKSSKVKALVSAFENVIFHLDNTSFSETKQC